MSQLKFIIIFSLAIIMSITTSESKSKRYNEEKNIRSKFPRVGCASFGHSCYGGFGRKRSDPGLISLEVSQSEDLQSTVPIMKVFPYSSSSQQQEKDIKILVLNTINQVVEETLKKFSDYEK